MMKKLHRKHEDKIRDFGNQTFGAFLAMDELMQGIPNVYDAVFSVLEEDAADYDFVLPAGVYLSYFYQGSYQQNCSRVQEVLAHAASHGLTLAGTPLSSMRSTTGTPSREAEFLTEIQVAISPASL